MSFEEAQEYISKRGLDIPWNDGDVFIDEREIMRTVGNVLKWADDTMAKKVMMRRDERMEWAEKIFSTIDKCFKEAHEEAIEAACSYLYAKTKMTGTEISKFRKSMEENLCNETSK